MRMSQHFGETLRKPPAEADSPGYELLLRAGYIRPLAPGLFSYLPLGLRSLRKIEEILREELDGIGGQEIAMPVVQPAALWAESGRLDPAPRETAKLHEQEGRRWVIGPSHEQVAVDLVRSNVKSYRQLPVILYQIQTTFRDEARARGGLLRAREFTLLASYSFDRDHAGLEISHRRHREAFLRAFEHVGLRDVLAARGDSAAGESVSEELMLLLPTGDDRVARCRGCGYAANWRITRFAKPVPTGERPAALEKVATPGTESIASLAEYLGVPTTRTAKVVFFKATVPESKGVPQAADGSGEREVVVMALVRGDMEVSEAKLRAAVAARSLRPAEAAAIRAVGAEPGYASPIGLASAALIVVADDVVARTANLISGANEQGYHYRNVNHGRDYRADVVADIAAVAPDAPCEECGSPLTVEPCLEVGSLHRFEESYTARLGATYQAEDGSVRAVSMGSFGVGVGRILGCIAETHRDESGLRLPSSVAPFDIHLVQVQMKDETQSEVASGLHDQLTEAGWEVLWDDRDERPGSKFADAELVGCPVRVTVGKRAGEDVVEVQARSGGDSQDIAVAECATLIQRLWEVAG